MDLNFDGFLSQNKGSKESERRASTETGHLHPLQAQEHRRIDANLSVTDAPPDRHNSITMTPTTQFLEQPELLYVQKGSGGQRLPPGGGGTHNKNSTNRNQSPPIVDDLLVDLHYASPHMLWTIGAGVAGFALGAGLNKVGLSAAAQFWISFPGYLFISALECLTLPLIFTSVTIGFANLIMSQKTQGVNVRVLVLFITASFLASCVALGVSFMFAAGANGFARKLDPAVDLPSARMSLMCPNGLFIAKNSSVCAAKQLRDAMQYTAVNITGVPFSRVGAPDLTQSFAHQIVAFFDRVFTQNIAESFASASILSVTLFSIVFGAGFVLAHDPTTGEQNHAFVLMKQVDIVLELILNWLLPFTPIGTFSAMAYYVMQGTLTESTFSETLYLTLALLVALVVHFVGVACAAYVVLVRKNPLAFFWYLLPAMIFMFGSSNYTATIPMLMRCIESSKQVSRTLAQYTVSVGVSLCLPGTAAFFVVAVVFMAYSSGVEDVLTPGRVLALVLVSTLSSIGVPHANGASLTYVATIWHTIFPGPLPPAFAFVVSVEWLTTRMRRTHNVLMVAFIARVIAEQLDETVEDEEDRVIVDRPVGLAHM